MISFHVRLWPQYSLSSHFTERKDLSHTHRELEQVEAFPVGSVRNIVPVALL